MSGQGRVRATSKQASRDTHTGYYFAVIALGNFFGPLLLGPLFDTVGRVPMISATCIGSGGLLFVTAWLFARGR
ncbi:hypothetical protein ACFSKW_15610 [Nonomuraea mangrovi]|uniref:MFS transporter n=1 Tax=Nonomuraea mangrovi TaxID=2316207 RepID=A0ABW4STP4_9ACTN